jgi:GGDEF domain-containing protein
VSAVATASDLSDEHEALLHFLYVAPVGLAQTSPDGDVVIMNPLSAQLLMPLSPAGNLTNVFCALEDVAPELRSLTERFDKPKRTVCSGVRIHPNGGRHVEPKKQTFCCKRHLRADQALYAAKRRGRNHVASWNAA